MSKTISRTVREKEFIFTIPDNTKQLDELNSLIEGLKKEVAQHIANNSITNESHEELYDKVAVYLDAVATLSQPCFAIRDQIEDAYTNHLINSPELAKKLWYEHYEEIHHPYTLLKNRCFRLFDTLDNTYEEKFKCKPPNWKD